MPAVSVVSKCLNSKFSKFKSVEHSKGKLDSVELKMKETLESSNSNAGSIPASNEKGKLSMSIITNCTKHANVGHVLQDGEARSDDVSIQEDVHFSDMYLNDDVLAGLHSTGFYRPSPVQLQAIPTGRCGLDLIVQAKSGTGKTCVFTVLALEMVAASATTTQVLVIAPTREIAVQIAGVMTSVGRHIKGLKVGVFIGGTVVENPGVCHIAVGTPGRLHHMLTDAKLCGRNIRLLVLDEADQMLDSFRNEVQQIVASLPHSKQVVCASATYTPPLQELAKKLMRSPVHVTLGSKQLLAVTQYVHKLPYTGTSNQAFRSKLLHLKGILGSATFNQCLIFTNSIMKAESVCDSLRNDGWPVACLCGGQTQKQRLQALDDLVTHRCRVLVATDLAARGLDSPHVSLVVSLEAPPHPHTYLHRVGRAGRFGAQGLSVVLAQQGDDWLYVQAIATMLDLNMLLLPEPSLQQLHQWKEMLPHLTKDQLQQWASTSNRKLEAWKMDAVRPQAENSSRVIGTSAEPNGVALNKESISTADSTNVNGAVVDATNNDVKTEGEIIDAPFTSPEAAEITEIQSNLKVRNDSSKKKDDIVELLKTTIGSSKMVNFSRDKYLKELHTLEEGESETNLRGVTDHSLSLRDLNLSEQRLVRDCLDMTDAARKAKTAVADGAWSSVARDARVELCARARGEASPALVSEAQKSSVVGAPEKTQCEEGLETSNGDKRTGKNDFSFHLEVMKEEKKLTKKQDKKFAQSKLDSENSKEVVVEINNTKVKKPHKHSIGKENYYDDWNYEQYNEFNESDDSVERDEYGDPLPDISCKPKTRTETQLRCSQPPYSRNYDYYNNQHQRSATYSAAQNSSPPRKTERKRRPTSRTHNDDQSCYDGFNDGYLGHYPDQTQQRDSQSDSFQPLVLIDRSKEVKIKKNKTISAVSSKVEKLAESNTEKVTNLEEGLLGLNIQSKPSSSKKKVERKWEDERASILSDSTKSNESRTKRKCEHPGCSSFVSSSCSSEESDDEGEDSDRYYDCYDGEDFRRVNGSRSPYREYSRSSHKPKSDLRKGHCLGCSCGRYPDSLSYLSTLHQFTMMDSFVRAMGRASALVAQQMRHDQYLWQGNGHLTPPSRQQRRRRARADEDAKANACDATLRQPRLAGSGRQRRDTEKSYTSTDCSQDSEVVRKRHPQSPHGPKSTTSVTHSTLSAGDSHSMSAVLPSRKINRKREKKVEKCTF